MSVFVVSWGIDNSSGLTHMMRMRDEGDIAVAGRFFVGVLDGISTLRIY